MQPSERVQYEFSEGERGEREAEPRRGEGRQENLESFALFAPPLHARHLRPGQVCGCTAGAGASVVVRILKVWELHSHFASSLGGQTILDDGSGLKYFLTDNLGSTVAIVDGSGTLISQQRYLPFGQVRADVNGVTQTDRGYTGQRSNTYINLMDYGSRWYDPLLGRFISPDSIIPNAANPQNLNHYSYVRNNPVDNSDPTGHCTQASYKNKIVSDDECDLQPATFIDTSQLSKKPHHNTGVSAADVYRQYMTMWLNRSGWWWKAYGYDSDGFSIWDYMSLYAFNEGEYKTGSAAIMAEAASRDYYQRTKQGYNATGMSGMLDWWAGFSQSEAPDVKSGNMPQPQRPVGQYASFSLFGSLMSSPPTNGLTGDWTTGAAQGRPYGWGNASVYNTYQPTAGEMFQANSDNYGVIFIYISGDDPFYVPSYCAQVNWVDSPGKNPDTCNMYSLPH